MARFEGEPFIDFKFGNYTNTDLGIKRVSNGNRYSYNINPTTKDITQENTGGWGTYYFKSYDKSRAFTIDFAFDHLTDVQLRLLRQVFAGDTEGDLIFAERPDWAYKAKVTGTPNIKFLAFENLSDKYSSNVINNSLTSANEIIDESTQIYKGEGQVQLTCYDPYSFSQNYIPSYPITPNQMTYFKGDASHYEPITFSPTDFEISFSRTVDAFNGLSITFYYREGNENKTHTQNITWNSEANKIYFWKSKIGVVTTIDPETGKGIPVNYSGPAYGFMPPNTYAYKIGYTGTDSELAVINGALTFIPRSY